MLQYNIFYEQTNTLQNIITVISKNYNCYKKSLSKNF